ncbi:MAG: hypothetical protein ACTSRA_02225 [Promethearchaeota archaeon]
MNQIEKFESYLKSGLALALFFAISFTFILDLGNTLITLLILPLVIGSIAIKITSHYTSRFLERRASKSADKIQIGEKTVSY